MRFHWRTLDLFGEPDHPLDPARGQAAVRGAGTQGVKLPASVAEWYCVPHASALWTWYCSGHSPAVWYSRDEWCMGKAESRNEWVNPNVAEDWSGRVEGPILPLLLENQGACWWGVVLDGSDDPPVVKSTEDIGYDWFLHAESFSAFVHATIFDNAVYAPAGWGNDRTVAGGLDSGRLRALEADFAAEPITQHKSGWWVFRFSGDGQRFTVCYNPAARSSGWQVWARDATSYIALVERLSRMDEQLRCLLPATRYPAPDPGRPPAPGSDGIPF